MPHSQTGLTRMVRLQDWRPLSNPHRNLVGQYELWYSVIQSLYHIAASYPLDALVGSVSYSVATNCVSYKWWATMYPPLCNHHYAPWIPRPVETAGAVGHSTWRCRLSSRAERDWLRFMSSFFIHNRFLKSESIVLAAFELKRTKRAWSPERNPGPNINQNFKP